MASLKTLKTRIKSVRSTQKMTKAMKMVATSRLKKAKHMVESSRPYADAIQEMIIEVASNVSVRHDRDKRFSLLVGNGKSKTHLIIIVSSDRGLCGGLNSATVKFTKKYINDLIAEGKSVQLMFIGRKAYDQISLGHEGQIVDKIFGIFRKKIDFSVAESIAEKIIDLFNKDKFDVCDIIYSKFKSAISQEQVCSQLIPSPIKINKDENLTLESPIVYEPNKGEILDSLLPKNLTIQIYNKLLENNASEQGARMAAMESATNNAGKMIKNLTLVYNRTRQANITKELIDIISGANSV